MPLPNADALASRFEQLKFAWDPDNPLSGKTPTIRDLSIHVSEGAAICAA